MNPWIILVAVLAVGGAGISGFIYGGRVTADHIAAQAARDEALAQRVRDAALKSAAQAIADIKINNTTIRQKTEETIREVPVYRDCRNDPAVLGLLNDALANRAASESAGDGSVPATDAPDR